MEVEKSDQFTVKIVENILLSVSKLAGVGVCIYNLKNFFNSGDTSLMKHEMKGHYCDFCYKVRTLPGGREACVNSDVKEAVNLAMVYKKPFFHTCHIGLTELVVPIIHHGEMLATVFLGQCRFSDESKFNPIWTKLDTFGADKDTFEQSFRELPVSDRSSLMAAGTLVDLSFKYLINSEGYAGLKPYFNHLNNDYVNKAVKYIESHYVEDITAKDIVDHVHLNPSYFARMFKTKKGCSISEYILTYRIEKAKSLLIKTCIPINSIAMNVGYTDQSYFTRKFFKIVGCSPSDYRKDKSLKIDKLC